MYDPGGIFEGVKISRRIGDFAAERRFLLWLISFSVVFAGYIWLQKNPQHDPMAPLDVRDPAGWATDMKMLDMIENRGKCRQALERSDVRFRALTPTGDGPCALRDRVQVTSAPLRPSAPQSTCPVAAGLLIWFNDGLQEAAQEHLGSRVVQVDHLGTNSCRRVNNRPDGPWSEHASGNAIDIAAFVLQDGRRISVLRDWGKGEEGDFLAAARDAACDSFRTVLSPDYNREHANHFHLDQGTRWTSVCR